MKSNHHLVKHIGNPRTYNFLMYVVKINAKFLTKSRQFTITHRGSMLHTSKWCSATHRTVYPHSNSVHHEVYWWSQFTCGQNYVGSETYSAVEYVQTKSKLETFEPTNSNENLVKVALLIQKDVKCTRDRSQWPHSPHSLILIMWVFHYRYKPSCKFYSAEV